MESTVDIVLSRTEVDACRQLFSLTTNYLKNPSRVFRDVEDTVTAEKLLHFFVAEGNARNTRRWAGILLEALIIQSSPIRAHIMSLEDWLPRLGEQTVRGDETLKLVSATIIRALASSSRSLPLFWPTDALGSQHVKHFPLGNSQTSSWVEKLIRFQDDVHSQIVPATASTETPGLYFIEHLTVDNKPVSRPGGSVYLVIQNGVTITLTPPDRAKIFYLDIPLNGIGSFEMHESQLPVQTRTSHCPKAHMSPDIQLTRLTLRLNPPQGAGNCFLNTKQERFREIVLSSADAEAIGNAITALKIGLDHRPENLDITEGSQPIVFDTGSAHRVGGSQRIDLNCGSDVEEGETGPLHVPESAEGNVADTARKVQTVGKLATLDRLLSLTPTELTRATLKVIARDITTLEPESHAITSVHTISECAKDRNDLEEGFEDGHKSDKVKGKPQQKNGKRTADVDVYEFVASEDEHGNIVKHQSKGGRKKRRAPAPRSEKPKKAAKRSVAKRIRPTAKPRGKKVGVEDDPNDEAPNEQIPQAGGSDKQITRQSLMIQDSDEYTQLDSAQGSINVPNDKEPTAIRRRHKLAGVVQLGPAIVNVLPKMKPGSSQEVAIAISSDKENSDSSDEDLNRADDNYQPPNPRVRPATSTLLIDEQSVRKMSIVSFSRTGPQNQGFGPTHHPSTAVQLQTDSAVREGQTYEVRVSRNKHKTQPTQPWYGMLEQLSDALNDDLGILDEPPTPPSKRRKLNLDVQSDQHWPDVDVVLRRQLLSSQSMEPARKIPFQKDAETLEPIVKGNNLTCNGNEPTVPNRRALHQHKDQEGVVPSNNKLLYQKSSQLSLKSVHISKDGSPILVDRDSPLRAAHRKCNLRLEEDEESGFPPYLWRSHSQKRASFPIDRAPYVNMMSSNSKTVPRSPEAESQAISGHAPEHVVQEALARSQQREISNPFERYEHTPGEQSTFMQRLWQMVTSKPNVLPNMEKTLVNEEQMDDGTSDSSYMGNEGAIDAYEENAALSAEEKAWEESIQPRHRKLIEVLSRIARRLVSHLVDGETAIDDIIEDYNNDGKFLINELEKTHYHKVVQLLSCLHASTRRIMDKYRIARGRMSSERKKTTESVGNGLVYWNQEHGKQQRQIEILERIAQMA